MHREPRHYLVLLVADLYRNAELQRSFGKDPKAVLDRYHIPPDVRALLWRRDREEIQSFLYREIDSVVHGMLHGTPLLMPYFGIQPNILTVSPSDGANGTQISFLLTGFYFDSDATLTFSKPATAPVVATNVVVTLTDKDTSATMMVGTAIFTEDGDYNATVANPPGSQQTSSTYPNAVQIR